MINLCNKANRPARLYLRGICEIAYVDSITGSVYIGTAYKAQYPWETVAFSTFRYHDVHQCIMERNTDVLARAMFGLVRSDAEIIRSLRRKGIISTGAV